MIEMRKKIEKLRRRNLSREKEEESKRETRFGDESKKEGRSDSESETIKQLN